MLSTVSNNQELSKITRLGYTQIGLNDSENSAILRNVPKDNFVRATGAYQICVDHTEDLTENLRPSLVKYMKGPFILSIYNYGDSIERSMLVFKLQALKQQANTSKGIIIDDPRDFTSQSLAVLPFIDVFKTQIDREAERASRLINASKIRNLGEAAAIKDASLVKSMTQQFLQTLSNGEEESNAVVKIGKEAITDTLATSLSANDGFYNALWQQMQVFYEPSFRYIAEGCALGEISLEQRPSIA